MVLTPSMDTTSTQASTIPLRRLLRYHYADPNPVICNDPKSGSCTEVEPNGPNNGVLPGLGGWSVADIVALKCEIVFSRQIGPIASDRGLQAHGWSADCPAGHQATGVLSRGFAGQRSVLDSWPSQSW
jgi:hypothetical protein